jgi:tetratricopeptide (TPR) repeat protein/transcriptional regulator with XRE-family HTH domain
MNFTFAELLRSFRQRASLDQAGLAASLGVHVNTIGGWERGLYRPRERELVLRLAEDLSLAPAETDQLLRAADFPTAYDTPHPLAARHQLRSPVADFIGRSNEIKRVCAALQTSPATSGCALISGVRGMGGVGKTELAYQVAHELRASFPDAQLVIELRGASATPLPPDLALQTLIRAFTPDARLPAELPDLQRLYCSLLHGQRVLILADDARDAAQVRPLIPPAGCVLLITSRTRFTLPGMDTVDLEQLDLDEAITFLHQICPRLSDAEAQEIARACGALPLALRVSGGILHNDPALLVAAYLAQLTDIHQRLAHLRDPDDAQLDVEASLALSYSQLDAEAQRVFRQLGVLVADFATPLAQAVVAADAVEPVEAVLRGLLRRNLVLYDSQRARWRLHDLVRALALRLLEEVGELEPAWWRYAQAALELAQTTQKQYLAGGDSVLTALAQFDAERPHIDASRQWATDHSGTQAGDVLLVAEALATLEIGDLRYDKQCERIPQMETALAAARRSGDQPNEARILNNLGIAYGNLGKLEQAIGYFEQRRTLARTLGDQRGEGIALINLGASYYNLGDVRQMSAAFEQVLTIMYEIGDRRLQGTAFINLGNASYRLGRLHRARDYYEQALAVAREIGNLQDESCALNNLGVIYCAQGDAEHALHYQLQALTCVRAIGHRRGEGSILFDLVQTYRELGDVQQATDAGGAALDIAREIGDQRLEGYALNALGRTSMIFGDPLRAIDAFEQALAILQAINDQSGTAECCWYYGWFLARRGDYTRALEHLRASVAYEQEIGHLRAEEHAALLARLEAGETLPEEIIPVVEKRAVGQDKALKRGSLSGQSPQDLSSSTDDR